MAVLKLILSNITGPEVRQTLLVRQHVLESYAKMYFTTLITNGSLLLPNHFGMENSVLSYIE